jgi:hypothetical protein
MHRHFTFVQWRPRPHPPQKKVDTEELTILVILLMWSTCADQSFENRKKTARNEKLATRSYEIRDCAHW